MSKNLIGQITNKDNFADALIRTRKGQNKNKSAAITFARNSDINLENLRNSIINDIYSFGDYNEFMVYEPKPRIINAPEYKDKIVQVALCNVLNQLYYPSFIYDSYACIDMKGTHACAMRIQHFLKKAQWHYGKDTYIIKIDIKKFFYSIDREILKSIIRKKIECEETLKLIFLIIDSADTISELGIPLGNTFSQLAANIYMNEIDQYAKRILGLKYYVRYADDIIIVVEDKPTAVFVLDTITYFINNHLNLTLNTKKTKIFPIKQGVNAIGYKIYPTHMLLRDMSKKKIKRKVEAMQSLIILERMTIETAEQMLNSWKGHANYADSFNFINYLMARFPYVYVNNKNVLKIDENILYGGI